MSADPVAPDTGEVLRLWLRSLTSIQPVVDTRIGLTLTGPAPAIRYASLGPGVNLGGGAVAVRYQIECWGAGGDTPDTGVANNVARTIVSETPGFVGIIGGARVSGASSGAPYERPDPVTNRPRSIVEIAYIASP